MGRTNGSQPKALFGFLDRLFHFDHDVCASPQTAKCQKFWTKQDDGLKQAWSSGKVYWMNAPYNQAARWARKAAEAARDGAVVVGLFANRSSTAWYRDYVVPSAMVVQLQGRLRFIHQGRIVAPGSMSEEAPFPSILAIWPREAGDVLLRHCTPVSAVLLRLPE